MIEPCSVFQLNSLFSVSKFYESADLMYLIPPYRFSIYAMGILLGFCLRKFSDRKMTKLQVSLGWAFASICLIATCLICLASQTYSPLKSVLFTSLAPITFCAIFAWIIFAAHLGHKSKFTQFIHATSIAFIEVAFRWPYKIPRMEIFQNIFQPVLQHLSGAVFNLSIQHRGKPELVLLQKI